MLASSLHSNKLKPEIHQNLKKDKVIPAEVFTKIRRVTQEDLDENKHVNNVRYVEWIQDIAKEHWDTRASSDLKETYFWVVIRYEIDYKKEALLGDEILVETYVGDTTFVTSDRFINIKNKKTGDLLVTAKSNWCLMDMATKRPTKITDELRGVFHKRS